MIIVTTGSIVATITHIHDDVNIQLCRPFTIRWRSDGVTGVASETMFHHCNLHIMLLCSFSSIAYVRDKNQ